MNRTSWIMIAVTFLICLLVGFFITKPNALNAWKTYKEILTAKSDLAQVSKKKEVLTALSKDTQLNNLFEIAAKYVPENDNSSELVIGLSAIASESKLGVDQLTFDSATAKTSTSSTNTTDSTSSGVKEVTFTMTTSGTFPDFLNFLKSTETSSRLITFTKMSFSQTDTSFMAQLSGKTYWKKGNTLENTLDNIKISQETINKFKNLKSYGTPINLSTESGYGSTNPFGTLQ